MKIDILISGFGGQGLLSLGKVLARIALSERKNTTWFPSYGAEMRGGTAHCFVKISESAIASPFIDSPDIAIIFNQPSLDKFKKKFNNTDLIIFNSDMINDHSFYSKAKKYSLPLNKIALECGNIKVANVVVLGVLSFLAPNFIKKNTVFKILREIFKGKKEVLNQNLKAFNKGKEIVANFQKV